jgi:hypothetical protein
VDARTEVVRGRIEGRRRAEPTGRSGRVGRAGGRRARGTRRIPSPFGALEAAITWLRLSPLVQSGGCTSRHWCNPAVAATTGSGEE